MKLKSLFCGYLAPTFMFAFNKEMALLQTSIYIHWHYTEIQQGWVAFIGT